MINICTSAGSPREFRNTSDELYHICKKQPNDLQYKHLKWRRIGQSGQNFSKKLKRDTFATDELKAIAEALEVTFE